ncbi:MAG TPA: N(4)-(beta-N-acetylglucosaminyl)-L-asparaginase [Terriglobales bacterium]|nr:N(4)-(beta-N-acetylglucosaminyl)-L-asparaginase [Terriglobales bacterium]
MSISRRDFLAQSALTAAGLKLASAAEGPEQKSGSEGTGGPSAGKPVIICKQTGIQSIDAAYAMLLRGDDTLDAVLHVLKTQEDDPNDDTVGLGGLPNEEGEVELDSCCMHGPTRRAGSVAAVQKIKNVCLVARDVMNHTGHVMLAGEGAQRFAVAMGYPRENLLTERSRKIWMLWKEHHSDQDWWGPGISDPNWKPPSSPPMSKLLSPELREKQVRKLQAIAADLGIEPEFRQHAIRRVLFPPTGTIHCSVVNAKGEMSGGTTTSGLAWKLPGRVGDSPILGAGCWTDQDVGSAGATGSGEENLKIAGAHTIVENMRKGMSPLEAGMDALKRIARNHNNDMTRLRYMDMVFYILRKDGAYAGVSLWSGRPEHHQNFSVHDGAKRLEKTVALFEGASIDWPEEPKLPPGS